MSKIESNQDYINILLSSEGQAYLDNEIEKMREQIGQEQFKLFTEQYNNNCVDFQNKSKEKIPSRTQNKIQSNPNTHDELEQSISDNNMSQATTNAENKSNFGQEGNNIIYQENQINKISDLLQLQNGNFILKYQNEDQYMGEMKEQIKQGWGEYRYANGQIYIGCFIDDEINGYGRYYFKSGAQYEGDWIDSLKQGIGILKFANGDVYEGKFLNDDLGGKGLYRYANGDVFDGHYKEGMRHGRGMFAGNDGNCQIGEWEFGNFKI